MSKKFNEMLLTKPSRLSLIGLGVFVAVLLLLPRVITVTYYLHILILCMIYSCITSAWNIIAGYAGVFSFGFQALFGLGAYVSALLCMRAGLSPWLSMWIGALASMCIGAVVAIPSLKLRLLPYICIATMCMGEIIRLITSNMTGLTRGEMGLTDIPKLFPSGNREAYYYMSIVLFTVVLLLVIKIVNSPLGMALKAMKYSQDASESLGINITRTKIFIYMFGAFIAGLIGGFYAHYMSILTPTSAMGAPLMTQYVAMCLIGGIGTVAGPVFGSFLITIALELLRFLEDYRMIFYALLIIVTIIFLRNGIWGTIKEFMEERAERKRRGGKHPAGPVNINAEQE